MLAVARRLARLARATPLVPVLTAGVVAAIAVGAGIRVQGEHDRAVAAALDKAEARAARLAELTRRMLHQADLATRLASLVARDRDGGRLERVLAEVQPPLAVLDPRGRLLAASPGLALPADMGDHEDFLAQRDAAAADGTLRVGRTMVDAATGEPAVLLSRRLEDAAGRFAGVVVSVMPSSAWVDRSAVGELGAGASLALLGTDGVRRIGLIDGVARLDEPSDVVPPGRIEADAEAPAANAPDGVRRYTRHRRVDGYPLVVAAGIAQRSALAGFRAWRRGFVGQTALAVLAIVLVAALLSHQAARLRRLQARAEQARREHEAAEQAARDHEAAEQATRHQLRLAQQVLEQTEEAILVTDEDDVVLMANPAFHRISGLEEHQVLGARAARLGLAPRSQLLAQQRGAERDRWAGQTVQRAADGREIPCRMSLRQWPAADGRMLTIRVWSDITPLEQAHARLERMALYDSLTGLPNRAHFHARLEHAVERARRSGASFAVCFIDLDDFKAVNDTLGHDAGDALLVEVARRLSSLVRAADTVCRLGGDEFTVIAEALKVPEDASALCERILAALAEPMTIAGRVVRASGSIGVCIYPDDGGDVAQLLKSADLAMYGVKEVGKNGYQFFSRALAEAAAARIELERQLRAAVREGQLQLAYLPKVDLRTRRAVGLEALLRWRRPQRGIELPASFLEVAGRSDLILELDDWVVDTVCAQLAAWRDAGLAPLPVAVNVSAREVQRGDLAARIAAALTRHRVDPQLLQVDLTERAMLADVPRARSLLEQLAVMGVHVAIDDFGSGDATLSRLGELPIGSLKIDRSLVAASTRDAAGQAAFESTVALAREMGFRAVAEGVEAEGQLELALRSGIEEAQGYRFGRPEPAEAVARLLGHGLEAASTEQRDSMTAELPFD